MSNVDYNKVLRKARIGVVSLPWRKILAFSFCLILSATFWFIQIYRQDFNTSFDIPVKYTHIPDSVVFETDLPPLINVTIRDKGYKLFEYFFTKKNDTLVINVSEIVRFSAVKTLQGASFEQVIKEKLLSSSKLMSYNPAHILFHYTSLDHKKVPVIFDGQILLAPEYLLNGDIQVFPDSVLVYGSKEVLKSLEYAYTVDDTIPDLKSPDPITFPIKKTQNLKFIPDRVHITVPVDKYTQKDISVPISCVNVPQDMLIRFFPSSVKISFLVGLSKYESITNDNFSIQFDYNDLKDLKESTIPLRITCMPDHIKNLMMSATEAEFIFEKN